MSPAGPLRALLVSALLAFMGLLVSRSLLAQEPVAQEHEVKATYLLQLPAFVEWPAAETREAPFAIAIVGADRVASELRALANGRRIGGRPLEVLEVLPGAPIPDARIVFVGAAETARLGPLAADLAGQPVLLVGEGQGALEQGAVLNFVLSEGRVRFEVSQVAAEARGLRVSSRLLALATRVQPGRP